MTWLYVPGTSSVCAPASAASSLGSDLLSVYGERLTAASATSKGKHLPPQAWSRLWKRGGFIRLLYGATCCRSTLDHGVDLFISSLREIHARTTASPELAKTAIDSSPPKSFALPKSAGLKLSSEKTCRGTRTGSSGPSSRHWSDWVSALRREYSARPPLAIPCAASVSSSWPAEKDWAAPCARDHFPAHTEEYIAAKKAEGHGMRNLTDEASAWMAPRVERGSYTRDKGNPDLERLTLEGQAGLWAAPRTVTGGAESAERKKELGRLESGGGDLQAQAEQWMGPNVPNGGRTIAHAEQRGRTMMHGDKKVQMGLEAQAQMWPGPDAGVFNDGQDLEIFEERKARIKAKGYNGNGVGGSLAIVAAQSTRSMWPAPGARTENSTRGSGQDPDVRAAQGHQVNLKDVACFFHPPSSPGPAIAGGSMSSTDGPNSNQPSVKRRLNPIFVEALMRWPTGLSGFVRPEMALTRWLHAQLSYLSQLYSVSEAPQQDLFG